MAAGCLSKPPQYEPLPDAREPATGLQGGSGGSVLAGGTGGTGGTGAAGTSAAGSGGAGGSPDTGPADAQPAPDKDGGARPQTTDAATGGDTASGAPKPPTGTITEFMLSTSGAGLQHITAGADGNLWFTEQRARKIGRITTSGTITEFDVVGIPNPDDPPAGPWDIAAGPDGNLWFTDRASALIFRIGTTGTQTSFRLPTMVGYGITAGPDGNLWFAGNGGNPATARIGRMSTTGTLAVFDLANTVPGQRPNYVTAGPDGNLWFTRYSGKVGRITPNGAVREFEINSPNGADVTGEGITAGPDGNVWFALRAAIARITPDGSITQFFLPSGVIAAGGIVKGPDNNLWFSAAGRIGRMTIAGTTSTFGAAVGNYQDITVGPDGNLWFTGVDRIGRITP
jgi:streptogramin lyase